MDRPAPRLIDIQEISDPRRGSLFVVSCGPHVPFLVKRTFFMPSLAEGVHRGGHAHRVQEQFLVCLTGDVRIFVRWPGGECSLTLDSPRQGLYLPPLSWMDIWAGRAGTSCLVLTSDLYDPADYINDHEEFEAICRETQAPEPARTTSL